MQDQQPTPSTYLNKRILKAVINGREEEVVEGLYSYAIPAVEPAGERLRKARPRFDVIEGQPALGAAESLRMVVNPLAVHRGAQGPNDPEFNHQWGLQKINAEHGWPLWNGQSDRVVIAVIDSGIPMNGTQLTHGDLSEARIQPRENFHSPGQPPNDDHGHGTHVAGILTASRDNLFGIAGMHDKGTVLIYKVFNAQNLGTDQLFNRAVVAALDFAEQQEARLIINYSGEGPDTPTTRTTTDQIRLDGALLVAAAGNQGNAGVRFPGGYAGSNDCIMCVASVDINLGRSPSSGRGPAVSIAAPGVDILSTLPTQPVTLPHNGTGFGRISGTSMATPLVTALAAMIWSQRPGFTAQEVRQRILSTATPLGAADEFGSGIIDTRRAMQGL